MPRLALLVLLVLSSCVASEKRPDLAAIYSKTAESIGPLRNPVVVIPGILGSKLIQPARNGTAEKIVWGAFTYGAADPDYPDDARLVALPMREGVPLSQLKDEVEPDGVLESLDANVGVARITAIEPYKAIIRSLAAGRYVDFDIMQTLSPAPAGAPRRRAHDLDFSGLHYTCFQFDYDWRRDVSEQAARLDALVRSASAAATRARNSSTPAKVDIVAHSMGGLVARYYLRYGTQPLPDDGTLPPVTWAGAELVDQVVIVGTPNAGSVLALKQIVEGVRYAPIVPTYQPALLCTFPSIFQLLPRARHARVVDDATGSPITDLYDVNTWRRLGWGPFDPEQDEFFSWLIPDEPDPSARQRIAADQLRKVLARAEQFHRALDMPATPPTHLGMHLIAGDADETPGILSARADGTLRLLKSLPGDGTVTRESALMDERVGGEWKPFLRSPIHWTSVRFLAEDHLGLTESPLFTDDILYVLLERQR
jgi:pimeloyl-ACP methyl ester carboxylesterase